MAKISLLPLADPLAGDETLVLVQDGAAKHADVDAYLRPYVDLKIGETDPLSIGALAAWPLTSAVRNGTESAVNPAWSNFLQAAHIIGAEDGKVYSLQRQNNEQGANGFGWAINEYVAAAMAGSNNAVAIMAIADPAPAIDRTKARQTIVIAPPLRPKLRIILTVDGTKLPAAGTPINSNSSAAALGYSWIIHPSCYALGARQDRMRLNAGEAYPLLQKKRDDVTTVANETLNRVLLDIKIRGARAGKFYHVAYIANGVNIGGPQYGVRIDEFDAATFATASAPVIVQNYTTPIPELQPANLDRTASELTFAFTPAGRPGMRIEISIDPSKLPADGTQIDMRAASAATPGKSWIVHPLCCTVEPEPVMLGEGALHVLANRADNSIACAWRESPTTMRRVTFARATFNTLWTFTREETAPLGDPATAVWTQLAASGAPATDWFPPLQVTAAAGGDGAPAAKFTGGNHGSDGGSGGTPTAKNIVSRVLIDGRDLDTFSGNELSLYAREVLIDTAADLLGYNTLTLDRAIVNQHFTARIRAGEVTVHCECRALEALTVWTDYGPQMTSVGFRDSLHFWGGEQQAKIEPWYGAARFSGAKSDWPTAAIAVIRGGTAYRASWVDQAYGLGDGSAVDATLPRMFASDTGKIYQGIVRSPDVGVAGGKAMAAGETYCWRGGYRWFTPADWSGDVEAAFRRTVGRKIGYAAILPAAGNGRVHVEPQDVDIELTGGAIVTPSGLAAVAAGYEVKSWAEA